MLTNTIRFTEQRALFEFGISKVHKMELRKRPKEYAVWLKEVRAQRFYDTDYSSSGLGVMPEKPVGTSFATDSLYPGSKKQYALKTYGLALVIQHEAYRWDLYGVFRPLVKQLAATATDRLNLLAYSALANAFSTADPVYTTYQGEALIKLAHKRMDQGTWKNRPTTNLGLSYVALQQATIDMALLVDERGRFVKMSPKLLVTSEQQRWIARETLGAKYRPDNAQMLPNLASEDIPDYHCSPYVTAVQPYFVMAGKEDYSEWLRMSLGEDPDFDATDRPGTRDRLWSSYMSARLDIYNSLGWWASSGDGVTSP